jgi:hypothetical protein
VYQIAGISVIVDAPSKLIDNEAFAIYRGPKESEPIFEIRLIEDDTVPKIYGELCFEDDMNRVYQMKEGVLHLFRIPFTQGIAAWNWIIPGNKVEIHYIKETLPYFTNSVGCFNASGFERILYHFNKYLFHCSYINYQGRAVLFSAPSGGGKTTQAKLWEQYADARIINGDRGVLEKVGKQYWCHGLPIAGSSGVFVNESLPIAAIFILKKAAYNKVTVLKGTDAFQAVFSELTLNTWNSEFMLNAVDFTMQLINQIPIYLLECQVNQEAVKVAQNVLLAPTS